MATETSTSGPLKVGIVIGSQRAVRICPQVAQFVLDVIKTHHTTSVSSIDLTFSLLDIATFDLPLTSEPGMPAHVTDRPAGYTTARTRAWSTAVAALDAFVFVTPQYNWGMPAALKNAIDHLFHEWGGKPAMVVSYGGHGGTLGAAALVTVLAGVFMQVVKRPVCMFYPGPDFLGRAVRGEDLVLDAAKDDSVWADQKPEIVTVWEEMLGLLVAGKGKPAFRSPGIGELWEKTIEPVAGIEAKRAAS